ncbi:hypothetical protein LV779_31855 [Streptomyces thinghirensis]|nr:hypothetical protein [Streptomyces thinghirensis]
MVQIIGGDFNNDGNGDIAACAERRHPQPVHGHHHRHPQQEQAHVARHVLEDHRAGHPVQVQRP